MHQSGTDRTVHEGMTEKPGEGIAGDVSDNGEPVLIESPEDDRLRKRNAGVEEGANRSSSLKDVPWRRLRLDHTHGGRPIDERRDH